MASVSLKSVPREHLLWGVLGGMVLLVVGKDFIHAFTHDYQFYISESLLFSLFWLLFIPGALANRRMPTLGNRFAAWLLPFMMCMLHMVTFSFLVFAISGLFFYDPFSFTGVLVEGIADDGLSCVVVYGVLAFLLPKVKKPSPKIQHKPERIRVTHRDSIVLLALEDILYIQAERPYSALVTEERTYLYNETLKALLEGKLTSSFVQIHKSTIVNVAHVASFKSRKNGDYDVFMANGDRLRMSRTYNNGFKSFSKETG